jgi:hypothetical protein
MSNPQGDTGGALGHQTPPPSKGKEKYPPAPKKPTEEEGHKPTHHTTTMAAFNIAKEHKYTMMFKRYICLWQLNIVSSLCVRRSMMLTDFFTPCLNYRERTPPSFWPLTPDCPNNFENGKFILPLGQLV